MTVPVDMIPEELKQLNQWVCAWNGKKLPMQCRQNIAASASDPSTWGTFADAVEVVENGYYDNIGFVFANNGIIGIDIDDGFDEEGMLSATALDIFGLFPSTYVELSRSGRGFHILCRGDLPFDGRNNRHGVEVYRAGRYFILTGDRVSESSDIGEGDMDTLLAQYFAEEDRTTPSGFKPRIYEPRYELVSGGKLSFRKVYPPIGEGCRNLSLTSLGGQLHSQGYDKEYIKKELIAANQEACKPPLPYGEVMQILRSVVRYKR